MRGDERDDLDRLLDRGLASYAKAEPRPGLEQRILRRVRDEGRRRWWLWAWLIPAVAGLVVFFVPVRREPARDPRVGPGLAQREALSPPGQPGRPAQVVSLPHRVTPHRPDVPKRRVFPTPLPQTDGERALVRFAESHPAQLAAFASDLQKSADPIQIGQIQIEPLSNGN